MEALMFANGDCHSSEATSLVSTVGLQSSSLHTNSTMMVAVSEHPDNAGASAENVGALGSTKVDSGTMLALSPKKDFDATEKDELDLVGVAETRSTTNIFDAIVALLRNGDHKAAKELSRKQYAHDAENKLLKGNSSVYQ